MSGQMTGTRMPTDHRVVWQYWETRGVKPAFVDGLHAIAEANAGMPVIQVTPETLPDYLPDLDPRIDAVGELAHKADLIRTRLVARYGGIWLDSDAIVLRDLSFLLDPLDGGADFVGFNNDGDLSITRPGVRINCFAARPGSTVMAEWVAAQAGKLDKTAFSWREVGTDLLHPICQAHADKVRILPLASITPVGWKEVARFGSRWRSPGKLVETCPVVMLSNKSLETRLPRLREMQVEEIVAADIYVSHFLRRAQDPTYRAPGPLAAAWRGLRP